MSRLAQQHAALQRALDQLSQVEQRAAVERLVAAAVRANGLSLSDAHAAGAVECLDGRAWDVQEQVERGDATREQYDAAFRLARAAGAAQTLADPTADVADAAYEAVHALPPGVDVLALIDG